LRKFSRRQKMREMNTEILKEIYIPKLF